MKANNIETLEREVEELRKEKDSALSVLVMAGDRVAHAPNAEAAAMARQDQDTAREYFVDAENKLNEAQEALEKARKKQG